MTEAQQLDMGDLSITVTDGTPATARFDLQNGTSVTRIFPESGTINMRLGLGLGLSHRPPHPAEGGGGEPEWVPEGAAIHIDLIGGDPQGRAWVRDVGEVAVDTLLGADANTTAAWAVSTYEPTQLTADGYEGSDTYRAAAFIGAARTKILAGATLRIKLKYLAQEGITTNPFIVASADGAAGIYTALTAPDAKAGTYAQGDILTSAGSVNTNVGAAFFNIFALTITSTRIEFSANGFAAEAAVLTETDYPVSGGSQIVAALIDTAFVEEFYQTITIYDALPDTTGLAALSAS